MKKIELDSPYISPRAKRYVNFALDKYKLDKEINIRGLFEKNIGEYLHVYHAFACNSGTNALHISLMAIGIKKGDEVITNPLTNIATISAILKCGARPILAEITKEGFMDLNDVEKKINHKTKAIIAVHFDGFNEDIFGLLKLKHTHDFYLVEDACQAFGSQINIDSRWKNLGTIGDIGAYSFGEFKILTTVEGGMIVTNNDAIAYKVNKLLGVGKYSKKAIIPGYNSKLDPLRCAVGLANLRDSNTHLQIRKDNWLKYLKELSKYGWIKNKIPHENLRINYSAFIVRIEDKNIHKSLIYLLNKIGYKINIKEKGPMLTLFSSSRKIPETLDYIYNTFILLPTHSNVSNEVFNNIASCFKTLNEEIKKQEKKTEFH